MIEELREKFNREFTQEKYLKHLEYIGKGGPKIGFRVAETPVFGPKILKERLLEACDEITESLCAADFKKNTEMAMTQNKITNHNEGDHTTFLQMDFAVTLDEKGELFPSLIEVQGFPSLYFFQAHLDDSFKKNFNLPANLNSRLGGLGKKEFIEKLRKIIVGDSDPKNVVLLDLYPEKQNTAIDFYYTQKHLGIKILCITKVIKRGKKLSYKDDDGNEIKIERIYNRLVQDELEGHPDLKIPFTFNDEIDAVWVGNPSWFFRIGKYVLPQIKSKYLPECFYLNEFKEYPKDLHNYVLKPIYSFASSGVNLHIKPEDLDALPNKANYILQKKVKYEPIIKTPNQLAICEIRMLMLWEKDAARPVIVNNLARLSKGEIMGVKFNNDHDWVGGSVVFFED